MHALRVCREKKEAVEAKGGVPDGLRKRGSDAVAPALSRTEKQRVWGIPNLKRSAEWPAVSGGDQTRGRDKRFAQSSLLDVAGDSLQPAARDPRLNSLSKQYVRQRLMMSWRFGCNAGICCASRVLRQQMGHCHESAVRVRTTRTQARGAAND